METMKTRERETMETRDGDQVDQGERPWRTGMETRQGGWQRIRSATVSGSINVVLLRLPACFAESPWFPNTCRQTVWLLRHVGAARPLQLCDVESPSAASLFSLIKPASRCSPGTQLPSLRVPLSHRVCFFFFPAATLCLPVATCRFSDSHQNALCDVMEGCGIIVHSACS